MIKTLALIIFSLTLLTLSSIVNKRVQKPLLKISSQESKTNLDYSAFKFFNLGNKRLLASLIWVDTLMDSDTEHYKKNDGNSWMFHRFYTISLLDPYFLQLYQYGGPYLSVIKDDIEGATKLYARGLSYYSDDYYLNFNSGYHYYFEEGDNARAIKLLKKVVGDPRAPTFLPSLIAKMEAESGDLLTAMGIVKAAYDQAPDGTALKDKFYYSLYSLKAEYDLECLNSFEKKNCAMKDLEGNPYLKVGNEYRAQKKWGRMRPHKRK